MRAVIILFIGQLIFLGCGRNNSGLESSQTDSLVLEKTKDTKISLDNFTEIPSDIEGCSCSYSASEDMYQRNEYLFVCGFDSAGYISIGGQLLKLKLVSTGREPDSFGDSDHVDIFKDDNYKITLDIKYKEGADPEDEGWYNNGTITIEDKNGQTTKMTFFGSCGC